MKKTIINYKIKKKQQYKNIIINSLKNRSR